MAHLIQDWVVAYSLILARTAAFVMMFPLFGTRSVPLIVRNALVIALSLYWMSQWETLPTQTLREIGSHWFLYGLMIAKEVIVGLVLGYGFSLILIPFRVAGEYIGQEMGLTIARITDPASGQTGTAVGQAFEGAGIMLLFQFNFHHVFIAAFHGSFARRPVGGVMEAVSPEGYIRALSWAQESGLALAAPVGCWLFFTMIMLAIMSKAAPQLNIMSVGFILRILAGLVSLVILFPEMGPAMQAIMYHFGQLMHAL